MMVLVNENSVLGSYDSGRIGFGDDSDGGDDGGCDSNGDSDDAGDADGGGSDKGGQGDPSCHLHDSNYSHGFAC